jgi:hypothetical protein
MLLNALKQVTASILLNASFTNAGSFDALQYIQQSHYRGHETENRRIIFTNVMITYFKILKKSAYEHFQTHRECNISLHAYFWGEKRANIIQCMVIEFLLLNNVWKIFLKLFIKTI